MSTRDAASRVGFVRSVGRVISSPVRMYTTSYRQLREAYNELNAGTAGLCAVASGTTGNSFALMAGAASMGLVNGISEAAGHDGKVAATMAGLAIYFSAASAIAFVLECDGDTSVKYQKSLREWLAGGKVGPAPRFPGPAADGDMQDRDSLSLARLSAGYPFI